MLLVMRGGDDLLHGRGRARTRGTPPAARCGRRGRCSTG
jgi:hypothetical protein